MTDSSQGGNLPRRSSRHNLATAGPSLGPEVNDPIGRGDHIEMMLDQNDAMPSFHQSPQDV